MSEQRLFDACVYHMVARGGAPREVVTSHRLPRRSAQLLRDLEELHIKLSPELLPAGLAGLAKVYGLELTL